jgi:hypothetical protein
VSRARRLDQAPPTPRNVGPPSASRLTVPNCDRCGDLYLLRPIRATMARGSCGGFWIQIVEIEVAFNTMKDVCGCAPSTISSSNVSRDHG